MITDSLTHVVCHVCDRAVPVEFYRLHRCEPMQPREHAVFCSLHHIHTWRPDGRCVLCIEDHAT